jgi:hypothetical protein
MTRAFLSEGLRFKQVPSCNTAGQKNVALMKNAGDDGKGYVGDGENNAQHKQVLTACNSELLYL